MGREKKKKKGKKKKKKKKKKKTQHLNGKRRRMRPSSSRGHRPLIPHLQRERNCIIQSLCDDVIVCERRHRPPLQVTVPTNCIENLKK